MSRYYEERKTGGHGCCGFVFTFFVVAVVIVVLLAFSTHFLDGYKNRVYELFYPQKYSDLVEKYAAEYAVDEALVYAVMKNESGFREEVESAAGAVGLMQLMPDTFEWLKSHGIGDETLSAESLRLPAVNIEYGTYLLSFLLDRYDDESTAVAAYNAGMTNVDNWLEDSRYSSDGKTLSSIPYEETEKYVDRVEKTKEMYERLYDQNESFIDNK